MLEGAGQGLWFRDAARHPRKQLGGLPKSQCGERMS